MSNLLKLHVPVVEVLRYVMIKKEYILAKVGRLNILDKRILTRFHIKLCNLCYGATILKDTTQVPELKAIVNK